MEEKVNFVLNRFISIIIRTCIEYGYWEYYI